MWSIASFVFLARERPFPEQSEGGESYHSLIAGMRIMTSHKNVREDSKANAPSPFPTCTASAKKHISSVARRIGRIQAVLELKDRAQIGPGKAKAVAFHLSDGDEACRRCHSRTYVIGE
jgi:hypothetical protein